MKANKAPEKIFICNYGSDIGYEWHSESEFETKGHNDIEYIRTDAFIRKAREYFIKELPNFRSFMESAESFIKNFEGFIKGE